MVSDVIVVVLVAAVMGVVRPLVDPGASFAFDAFSRMGHELFGSVAIGTTLGLVIAAYLRLVNRQMLVVLLLLGFGVSSLLDYLHFDSLLAFMVAGFIVRNVSQEGHKFIKSIEQTGTVVYVVFFAIAGADLDVPLLRALWPVALILAGARALLTWATGRHRSERRGRRRRPPQLGLCGARVAGRSDARALGHHRARVPHLRRAVPRPLHRDRGGQRNRRPRSLQAGPRSRR